MLREQDMLLLAGSKMSYSEIYAQEINLPTFKNKYYSADDVDNLFVIINGVFTAVSEQAFRNDKALATARETASKAESEAKDYLAKANELESALITANQNLINLQQQVEENNSQQLSISTNEQELLAQLDAKTNDYTRLLESTSDKMSEQGKRIDELANENENLKLQLQSVTEELQGTPMPEIETGLQSEFNMLQYKYNTLKKLSTQRIQELTNEMNTIKELGHVK